MKKETRPRSNARAAGLAAAFVLALFPPALPVAAQTREPVPPRVAFSAEEQAFIAAHPVIRVMVDNHWAPLEFIDSAGRRQGVTVDLLEHIEGITGLHFEFSSEATWSEGFAALGQGGYDMASSIVSTPSRREYLDFTKPYITLPNMIFGGLESTYVSDLHMLAGKRVLAIAGYAINEFLGHDHPEISLTLVPDAEAGVAILARGGADYFISDVASVGYYIQRNAVSTIKVVGETPYLYQMAMAVRKDRAPLASILVKALDSLPEEEMRAIRQRWFTIPVERRFDWRIVAWAGATVLVAAALALAWILTLSARVKARTAELAAANEQLAAEVDKRASAEAELTTMLKARELLLKELNHRIKNQLMVVLSLVRLSSEEGDRETLQETAGRIEAIARVHDQLATQPVPGAIVDLGSYLSDLAEGTRRSALEGTQVDLEVEAPRGIELGLKEAMSVGMIANELVMNAIKYAFPGGLRGRVRLTMERSPENDIIVTVEDDGVGMEEHEARREGSLGAMIVRALADGIGACLDVRSGSGTGTSWTLRVHVPAKDGG